MLLGDVLDQHGLDVHVLSWFNPVPFHRLKCAGSSYNQLLPPHEQWLNQAVRCADADVLEVSILELIGNSDRGKPTQSAEDLLDELFVLTSAGRTQSTIGSSSCPVHNPLDLAVQRSMRHIIPLLRMRGYDLELLDQYSLESLVQEDEVDAVAAYLEAGISVDIRANAGRSLLMVSMAFRASRVAPLLLKWNADIDQKSGFGSWTALMWAAHVGWEEGCKMMLDARADVEAKNDQGMTALAIAERWKHEAVISLLSTFK